MSCIYSHEDGAYCDKYSNGAVTLSCSGEEDCPDRIVKTNADRIRQMSDKELAHFFRNCVACDDCPIGDSKCKRAFALCESTALSWLKCPSEEGE